MGFAVVRVLLDTHAVIWSAEDDARLGKAAASLLKSLQVGEAMISDISLLEIAMLQKKGRVTLSSPCKKYLRDLQRHYPVLAITPDIASLAVDLELPQGDPFDRIIVATAIDHDLPLLTRDRHMVESGLVRVVW